MRSDQQSQASPNEHGNPTAAPGEHAVGDSTPASGEIARAHDRPGTKSENFRNGQSRQNRPFTNAGHPTTTNPAVFLPAAHLAPGYALAVALAGAWAVLVGGAVLTGWAFDIAALKSVLPGWVSMKPNTALAFILTAMALLFSRPLLSLNPLRATASSRLSRICGTLAGLIGLLSLCEYAFGWNPGFDQWLFREPSGTVGTSSPGRMAPEAAVCFILLAGAFWITSSSRKTHRAVLVSTMIGLLVTTLALAAMLSYFTPTLGTYGWWGLTIMAVPTATTFTVLGLAVMLLTWQEGAWSWALSKTTTAVFACGLALFIVIGLDSSRSVVHLNETNRWVTHTERVLHTVSAIQGAVAEAQTHTRGYVITGDERFLASNRADTARGSRAMDALRKLTAGDPSQQPRIIRLEKQVNEALQWFQSVIAASRAGLTDADRRRMVGHGEDLMESLRTAFGEIENEEGRMLQQRQQEAESVARFSYLVISLGTLASLMIFLGVLFGLNLAEVGRKRADGALRETNEYLENLFNYANAPIIVWDAEGKITRFNQAFEEIAGLKAAQVLGKGLDLLFAEDQRERAMGIVRRAGAGERFDLVEVPICHPSGSQRTVLWNSAPVFGADKEKQIATIAQGQDITERKAAEGALRDSEESFRTMANSIPQLAWIAKADGFIFWYNQRWYEYTGTTPEQMEGWGWQSVHDPKVLPKVMENWTDAIVAGRRFEMEFPLRGADGRFRNFLTRGQPLKNSAGQVVQWFGTNTDVETMKLAEEALREANILLERRVAERTAELGRSKQLLDEAGRLARVGGWEIDLENNAVSWSDMVREIHEVGPEFRPTVETAIDFYSPESIPVITAAVRCAIQEGQPYDLELELISAKGRRLWVRSIGQPYRDRGKIARIVGMFQDITGPRQIAEKLKRNRDDLEAANKELESFAYSVSHDLRAPLRSIDGFSRILLEDCADKLDADNLGNLHRVRAAAQRMGLLIDDLLQLSRVVRDGMSRERVDLSALADAVVAELRQAEPARSVECLVPAGIAAEGDPRLLRVVLENLLGNAWKFTGRRERARIEFGTVQQDGATVYFVRDNGAGYDVTYAGKLFGAFQRLHSTADFPGTGIGLATVQRIVHRHGGRVWAEGEVNQGATFYFNLGAPA